jgi:hypothetical protein
VATATSNSSGPMLKSAMGSCGQLDPKEGLGFGNKIRYILIFGDNSGYSGGERFFFQDATGVTREQTHRNVRHYLLQRLRGLNSIHDGHGEVRHNQVRSQLLRFFNGLPSILGLSTNAETTGGKYAADSFSHHTTVIYDEDTPQHRHRFVGLGQEGTHPLGGQRLELAGRPNCPHKRNTGPLSVPYGECRKITGLLSSVHRIDFPGSLRTLLKPVIDPLTAGTTARV